MGSSPSSITIVVKQIITKMARKLWALLLGPSLVSPQTLVSLSSI